ncbi:MAG: glucosamine 6-phosphate synthetase [Ruminococcus sp.]|nr:glucosamine 6-phosphate synthetase [Ruminococcus sp.]
MCALFGWLDYGKKLPHRLLKKLTQTLANAAEERGTDATGISYIRDGQVIIYKRPKPAHKIHFNAPDGTTAIMGHTRLTTQGNQKFNQNNHPFPGHADKEFSFAHNGVLYNDTALRKSNNLPKTNIETDSYVAVQLIEQQKKLDFNSLKSMAETVQGNFTFTTLDEDNSLYIVKGSNPMCLLHFEMLGIYIYASTESIMKNALRKVNMLNFPNVKIETVHGDIIKIDSNGIITRSEFENKEDFRYASWLKYSYDDFEDDYYNQHEQLLLEMCGCYGIDEDDVIMLLDYGYAADEIEDMFMDYDLLHATIQNIKCNDYYDDFLMEM